MPAIDEDRIGTIASLWLLLVLLSKDVVVTLAVFVNVCWVGVIASTRTGIVIVIAPPGRIVPNWQFTACEPTTPVQMFVVAPVVPEGTAVGTPASTMPFGSVSVKTTLSASAMEGTPDGTDTTAVQLKTSRRLGSAAGAVLTT